MDPDPTKPKPIIQPGGVKEEILPTSERNKKIKDKMLSTFTVIRSLENKMEKISAFQKEIVERVNYLKSKYPDYQDRTISHALSGSSIYVSHPNIIEDDFPGDDSVEKFVNYLAEKYGKKPEVPPTE